MGSILVPSFGPGDWRRLLADPELHWKAGRSAYELAVAWEGAQSSKRRMPAGVTDLLDTVPELAGSVLLLGLPEHKVPLDGGGRASQTDLWGLLRGPSGLISLAVEGKAGEPFDRMVPEWLADASPRSGKPARLKQLCSLLGISEDQALLCRYQLLHRTAVAILEAQRFALSQAVMLVQSFQPDPKSLSDFECFGRQLNVTVGPGALADCGPREGVHLWLGWLDCAPARPEEVVASV